MNKSYRLPVASCQKILFFAFMLVTGNGLLVTPLVSAQTTTVETPPPATSSTTAPNTVTVELKGVDILDVLDFFSKESGLNIIAGQGVTGQVTVFLREVEIHKALETILEAANLGMIEEEGLIKIVTQQEYFARFGKPFNDRRILKSFALHYGQAEKLAPLLESFRTQSGKIMIDTRSNTIAILDTPEAIHSAELLIADLDVISETRTFNLRYAKAEDLEPKIKSLISPETGSIQMDARSNRIVINDTPKTIDRIAKVIESFDAQPPQVLIEARVVQVTLTDSTRFGIDWNLVFDNLRAVNEINLQPNYSVTAPTGGTLTTLSFGSGGDDVQAVVQALEQFGKTNTLSSPRITVVDDQEAKLAVATREPFVTQTTVQGTNTSTVADNVQFIDVGVTMKVKPKIAEDGYIVMKIQPQVSTQGAPLELEGVAASSDTTFIRTRVPVVTTQEFDTTVMIKDGHTIVIGGLIQDSDQKIMQKFPMLADIPFIGALLRSKTHNFSKTELVVFLTPRIVRPSTNTTEDKNYFNKKGQLLPFDRMGGYPFDKGIYQSQNPLVSNDKAYWQINSANDYPELLAPSNINSRPYDRYRIEEKKPLVEPQA